MYVILYIARFISCFCLEYTTDMIYVWEVIAWDIQVWVDDQWWNCMCIGYVLVYGIAVFKSGEWKRRSLEYGLRRAMPAEETQIHFLNLFEKK